MAVRSNRNIVIFASGAGSNARAIASTPDLSSRIAAVVSDREESAVLEWARDAGYTPLHVSLRGLPRHEADRMLLESVRPYEPSLIVLAGFMRILGSDFVCEYGKRIVNIHPSLLPKHRGLHAIERSWEAGDQRMGITIHLVDQGVDTGPALAQASLPRELVADVADAERKIHELEHALYPVVISELLSRISSEQPEAENHPVPYRALQTVLPSYARLEIPGNDD